MREAKFDVNDEILRPYFPLPQVMQGLFDLVNKLFGIEVEAADGMTPIWNKDVRFFKISKDGLYSAHRKVHRMAVYATQIQQTRDEHQWIVAQRLLSSLTIPGFK